MIWSGWASVIIQWPYIAHSGQENGTSVGNSVMFAVLGLAVITLLMALGKKHDR